MVMGKPVPEIINLGIRGQLAARVRSIRDEIQGTALVGPSAQAVARMLIRLGIEAHKARRGGQKGSSK